MGPKHGQLALEALEGLPVAAAAAVAVAVVAAVVVVVVALRHARRPLPCPRALEGPLQLGHGHAADLYHALYRGLCNSCPHLLIHCCSACAMHGGPTRAKLCGHAHRRLHCRCCCHPAEI